MAVEGGNVKTIIQKTLNSVGTNRKISIDNGFEMKVLALS